MIGPVIVERDSCGYWIHPDYPLESEIDLKQWNDDEGIYLNSVWLEDDNEEISERYWEGCYDISDWQPTKPQEDSFLLFICDTEDGPLAMFATPRGNDVC